MDATRAMLVVVFAVLGLPRLVNSSDSAVGTLIDRLKNRHGFTTKQLSNWVVVGNGPLTTTERNRINSRADDAVTVRFNDENNFETGDVVHVHAIRHPSWSARRNGLEEWHIAPFQSSIPKDAAVATLVYEQQHGLSNEAVSTQRLFPSTCNHIDTRCWVNRTIYGASTGAVVLSALHETESIANITVFGMNWNGDAVGHIDFQFPMLVAELCSKCEIVKTHDDSYGQSGTITAIVVLCSVAIFGTVLSIWVFDMEVVGLYKYVVVNRNPQPPQPPVPSVQPPPKPVQPPVPLPPPVLPVLP